MRRFLVVIEDIDSGITVPEELADFLAQAVDWPLVGLKVLMVRRGGLLADKVMEELPPVRHRLMGRARG